MTPLPCRYEGEGAFTALPGFRKIADRERVIGEVYRLADIEDRSDATHKHEFAWLREAWMNLPEHLADQYPSAEHLRKRALIDAGFHDEQIVDVGTNAGALRVAASIRGFPGEEFSLVIVRGPLVVVRRAKSQSRRAMNKAEFQASKTAVLETVAALIGVQPEQLKAA